MNIFGGAKVIASLCCKQFFFFFFNHQNLKAFVFSYFFYCIEALEPMAIKFFFNFTHYKTTIGTILQFFFVLSKRRHSAGKTSITVGRSGYVCYQ